jgi:hypothetical protein
MYTIKGLMDAEGQSAILATAKDWNEALAKATEFRKQGMQVEIWHQDGMKVDEPESNLNA